MYTVYLWVFPLSAFFIFLYKKGIFGRLKNTYRVIKTVSNVNLDKPTVVSDFKLNPGKKSACITYNYLGETYIINVPYSRRTFSQMSETKVYLIRNGEEVDITQQKGTNYTVSAGELGGEQIKVVRGENVKYFNKDDVPIF